MEEVSMIGLDLAKNIIQIHGANAAGEVVFRKKLQRRQVLVFLAGFKPCTIAMEACGGSHYWAREVAKLGHFPRLIAPAYVKPFVKRQKNDAADAEAICEAAARPTMRFVAPKSEEQQSSTALFRVRDMLVIQRTQLINALRGHLLEFGLTFPVGAVHASRMMHALNDPAAPLPTSLRGPLNILADQVLVLEAKIADLDRQIAEAAKANELSKRLMTIPGVGPVIAFAVAALAPPPGAFKSGRDFASWVGLTPRQSSSGGKERLGRISKMGERTLRRLLTIGAASLIRWNLRQKGAPNPWLSQLLARKPRMVATVALANKIARIVWALIATGGVYKARAVAA